MVRQPIIATKKKKLYRCYACSYLENGVLTDRNGKKTNYCNKQTKKKLSRCYACSYLENGVLTERNGKKINYCSKKKRNCTVVIHTLTLKMAS